VTIHGWFATVLLFGVFTVAAVARAQSPQDRFAAAATALSEGAFDRALGEFEALADSGFEHPDASYDRAIAYIQRARSPQEKPGDLGRAVAALVETLELRPDDRQARAALETVRHEIAQRRIRAGREPAVVSPSLGRAVVGLLDESVWTLGALIGSLLLSVGLGIRWLFGGAPIRLAGGVTASIGALLLVTTCPLVAAAAYYRTTSRPAVVVVPEARLLTENGTPLDRKGSPDAHPAAPEGAKVYVLDRRGRLARIEWGSTRAWVLATDLRLVATR